MINGLYGYFFGAEEEELDVTQMENQENEPSGSKKVVEDDWLLIEECGSGRSSPVLVPNLELEDIDELSLKNEKIARPSKDLVRRAEANRQAKLINAKRLTLQNAMFTEVPQPQISQRASSPPTSLTGSRLKRVSAVAHGDCKPKQRSKKAGKLSSGRNNDRKVNNLN